MEQSSLETNASNCANSTTKHNDEMVFCTEYGAKIEKGLTTSAEKPVKTEPTQTEEDLRAESEGLRWVYEMNMWKNPVILFTVYKVLGISVLIVAVFLLVLFLLGGDSMEKALETVGTFALYAGAILLVLVIPAYILISVVNGGKYCVFFEMDEVGVNHIQMQKQFKKNQILSALGIVMGSIAGSPTTAGANLLAMSKKNTYTDFSSVRNIRIKRNLNTIYLNAKTNFNQIYAADDQFDAISEYIVRHCPKAKVN